MCGWCYCGSHARRGRSGGAERGHLPLLLDTTFTIYKGVVVDFEYPVLGNGVCASREVFLLGDRSADLCRGDGE